MDTSLITILSSLKFFRNSHSRKKIIGDTGRSISLGYVHKYNKSDGYTEYTKKHFKEFKLIKQWFRFWQHLF